MKFSSLLLCLWILLPAFVLRANPVQRDGEAMPTLQVGPPGSMPGGDVLWVNGTSELDGLTTLHGTVSMNGLTDLINFGAALSDKIDFINNGSGNIDGIGTANSTIEFHNTTDGWSWNVAAGGLQSTMATGQVMALSTSGLSVDVPASFNSGISGNGANVTNLCGGNITAGSIPFSALGFSTAPYNLAFGPFPAGAKGCYTVKGANIGASATVDLLPMITGVSGYVSSLFIYTANPTSVVNVYLNGASTAAISCPLQDLIAGHGGNLPGANAVAGNPYFSFQGLSTGGFQGFGGSIQLAIPFKTGIHITLTNANASVSQYWCMAEYQTGVAVTSIPLTQQLFASYENTSAATYGSVVTLVNATGLNPGQLAGFYLSLDGTAANNAAFLEGEIKIYVDGGSTPIYQSSGTEDTIGMPNYFYGIPSGTCDSTRGLLFNNNTGQGIFRFYKMFAKAPLVFNNALKITWDAGETTAGSFTGSVNVNSTTYFLTQ
jgi:hypothetical protein